MNASRQGPALVALIDDHPLFRMGLRAAFERDPQLQVVIDSGSPREVLAQLEHQRIDVAVVDLLLPELSGAHLVPALRKLHPTCVFLGLSMLDDPGLIAEVLRAGAAGFAHKSQPPAEIIEAVHQVLGGVRYLPPWLRDRNIDRIAESTTSTPLEQLTAREREVFMLMIDGLSNDEIASRLFIARRTVEAHRYHVMHKLAAKNIGELIRTALRLKVLVA